MATGTLALSSTGTFIVVTTTRWDDIHIFLLNVDDLTHRYPFKLIDPSNGYTVAYCPAIYADEDYIYTILTYSDPLDAGVPSG